MKFVSGNDAYRIVEGMKIVFCKSNFAVAMSAFQISRRDSVINTSSKWVSVVYVTSCPDFLSIQKID